ncbi:hypothetical protein B7C51_07715 [Paenibacillus larvae subsp. pulvifaciens]|uniref:CRISPR-associated protein Csh1 n=1 Tax=Paenibacillus larvae subsp. pulvifaciens TaxID=1477 RepID=A0A1V0UR36_9BACL|nr:hypothetical protein [Paenibacillus larvae]ARF67743.1 hypothetical protein B7C51_07715 [Paenibacillus larvae subsp. pulvifaciens]
MLKDMAESYQLAVQKFPNLIFDQHMLKEGLYLRLRVDKSWEEQSEAFEGNHLIIQPKEEQHPENVDLYDWFTRRDYYSSLVAMNKPVDSNKQIHSNNPFALYVKREVFLGEKSGKFSMQENVTRFLNITYPDEVKRKWKELLPAGKVKNTQDIETFFMQTEYADALHYLTSDFRQKWMERITRWYASNLNALTGFLRQIPFKNYVKLYFTTDFPTSSDQLPCEQLYAYEYTLYTIPKISNKNDYNQMIKGTIFGLPSFNINMNGKKPFLKHRTMRVQVPIRVSLEQAMLIKQTAEWLMSKPKYITNKFAYTSDFTFERSIEPEGTFHIYVDGKDNEVVSFENVPFPSEFNLCIYQKNILQLRDHEGNLKPDKELKSTEEVQKTISSSFFRGRMSGQFLYDEPKAKSNDFTSVMAALFMQSKQAFHDWLFKGTAISLRPLFSRLTLRLLEEQLLYVEPAQQSQNKKVLDLRWLADAFNLRLCIADYLNKEGSRTMTNRITEVMTSLKQKFSQDGMSVCGNDDEFYFLTGQLAFYLKSQSETQNKTGDLLSPFLVAKRSEQLKKKLEDAYILHKHKIKLNHAKFNKAFSNIFGYKPDGHELTGDAREMFLAGLFADNWFYEKPEKKKNDDKGADYSD